MRMQEKKSKLIITEVSVTSILNRVHVELSPVELTSEHRKALSESSKDDKIMQLKRPMPVELTMKLVSIEKLTPLVKSERTFNFNENTVKRPQNVARIILHQKSEAFTYINGPKFKRQTNTAPIIAEVGSPLEVTFELCVPVEGWKGQEDFRVAWWKDGGAIYSGDERFDHLTEFFPANGILSLRIDRCRPEDEGHYQVTVYRSGRVISTSPLREVSVKRDGPKFIKSLPDLIHVDPTEVDAALVLRCQFEVKSMPEVTWYEVYKDGRRTSIGESGFYETSEDSSLAELRIRNVPLQRWKCASLDGVLEPGYVCKVQGRGGCAETSTKLALKKCPPRITTRHEDSTLSVGGRASIICRALGWPKPKLRWVLNGESIVRKVAGDHFRDVGVADFGDEEADGRWWETTQVFSLERVSTEVEGILRVVARNELGGDLQEAKLTIAPAMPSFSNELSDVSITEGEPLFLSAKIIGHPPPKVTWYRDDQLVLDPNVEMSTVRDQYSLYLPRTKKYSGGRFSCTAVNSVGTAVSSSQVVITEKISAPTICYANLVHEVCLHGDCTFEVLVAGEPDVHADWLRDGHVISSGRRFYSDRKNVQGRAWFNFMIDRVEPDDAGFFEFHFYNETGEVSVTGTLNVTAPKPPPNEVFVPTTILKGLNSRLVELNEDFVLLIEVVGRPEPKCRWLKNEVPIESSAKFKVDSERGVHTLTISSITEEDCSIYRALVWGEAGNDSTSAQLFLKEGHKPNFEGFRDMRVQEGQDFCLIFTAPKMASIDWSKDNLPLSRGDSKYSFKEEEEEEEEKEEEGVGSIHRFTVRGVSAGDQGRYTVCVQSGKRKWVHSSFVTVEDARNLEYTTKELLVPEAAVELLCRTRLEELDGDAKKRPAWVVEKAFVASDGAGRTCMKWESKSLPRVDFTEGASGRLTHSAELVITTREPCKRFLWMKNGRIIRGDPHPDNDAHKSPKYKMSTNCHDHKLVIGNIFGESEDIYSFKVLH